MAEKFGLPTPQALVASDVLPVTITGAAAIVPVSGSPIAVSQSGSWTVAVSSIVASAVPDITGSGTIAALNANVGFASMNGIASVVVKVSGTWVATLGFFGSIDSFTSSTPLNAYPSGTGAAITTTAANGTWIIPCAGFQGIQVFATAYTSGTATVLLRGSVATFPLR